MNHLGAQGTFKAEKGGRGQGRGEETEEPLGGENLKRELRRQNIRVLLDRQNQTHAATHNICGLCVPRRRCPVVPLSLRAM